MERGRVRYSMRVKLSEREGGELSERGKGVREGEKEGNELQIMMGRIEAEKNSRRWRERVVSVLAASPLSINDSTGSAA